MSKETYYTFGSNDIYFLNDKNIVSSITENANGLNAIPSMDLFKSTYDELSAYDDNLSAFIRDAISADLYDLSGKHEATKAAVEASCASMSSLVESLSNDLSNAITADTKHLDDLQLSVGQMSSEINRLCNEISDDVVGKYEWLSSETSRLCSDLSSDVESKFVHKAGDNIDYLDVNHKLSAEEFYVKHATKAAERTYVTELSVDKAGINAIVTGRDNNRSIRLSVDGGTKNIYINDVTLSDHIRNEVKVSSDSAISIAKDYTDTKISGLDTIDSPETGKFVTVVNETDGIISVERAALKAADIPTIDESQVSNLVGDLQNLSSNYVKVSDFKTSKIDNDGKLLSAEDFNLTYDETTHQITLKAGLSSYSFSAIDFIKSRTVHHLAIETDDITTWLKIYWTENEFIRIDIKQLVKVYAFEDGISSYVPTAGGEIHVYATDKLARTAYADAISSKIDSLTADFVVDSKKTISKVTQTKGQINIETKDLLSSDVVGLTEYVTNEIKLSCDKYKQDLDVSTISADNKLLFAVAQTDGSITAYARALVSSDFSDGNKLDEENCGHQLKQFQIENLPETLKYLSDSIDIESSRATKFEKDLSGKIDNEIMRAEDAENDLRNSITAEETRSKEKDDELESSITSETVRANAAESALSNLIRAEKNRATAAEQENTTAITSEQTRAEAAEAVLQNAIDVETLSARAAEQANATAIAIETSRAKTAEEANTTAIVDEIDRAKGKENTLSQFIHDEVLSARAEEQKIADNLTTETARAKNIEADLQQQCTTISGDLQSEITSRIDADSLLNTKTETISSNVVALQAYADKLSGYGTDIGIIATLSNDISSLQNDAVKELKFNGHMRIDSNLTAKTIPDLFKTLQLGYDTDNVKNGSVFNIKFDGVALSDGYELDEGITLADGCYFIVHDHSNLPLVKIDSLNAGNCYLMKSGVKRYEFEREVIAREAGDERISTWLSANFKNAEELDPALSVTTFNYDLSATKDIAIDGKLLVNGKLSADDSKLTVNAAAEFNSTLSTASDISAATSIHVSSNLTITDASISATEPIELGDVSCVIIRAANSGNRYKMTIDDSEFGTPIINFERI